MKDQRNVGGLLDPGSLSALFVVVNYQSLNSIVFPRRPLGGLKPQSASMSVMIPRRSNSAVRAHVCFLPAKGHKLVQANETSRESCRDGQRVVVSDRLPMFGNNCGLEPSSSQPAFG